MKQNVVKELAKNVVSTTKISNVRNKDKAVIKGYSVMIFEMKLEK